MEIRLEDVQNLYWETPAWTRRVREFRMDYSTWRELKKDDRWEYPWETMFGLPVVLSPLPFGEVHFEIPVPEIPRGKTREDPPKPVERLLGVVADPFPRS